ncbi:cubilin homolog [Stomoxys calcitrans]|uniref:cubilin homolog n=1 Tax=Stomoxys calcitrans TaxID=35570 RepID=UPI0027E3953A|nr:cubilin homolog [Stomoxys calcitrans]
MFLNFAVIVLIKIIVISAGYDGQPKILTKNAALILEASYDQNISLRLSHGSSLLVNHVDVMEHLRRRYTPSNLDRDPTKSLDTIPTADEIGNTVLKLRGDIDRLNRRFSYLFNRTRTPQPRSVRRLMGRLRRLSRRVLVIEENITKNECTEATEPCKNGGTCYDSYKGYHCECPEGWKGKTCEEDVDECYLWAGTDLGCQNNAACSNTPGIFKCTCANGFSGTHCRIRKAICQQEQAEELCGHGICVPANNAQGFTCICNQGWTRNISALINSTSTPTLACDVDIDECEASRNPCHNECINLPGSFKCGPCPPGYTGNGKTCIDIDECASNNGGCNLMPKVRCINTEGSHFCGKCPPGWIGDGRSCELAPSSSCDEEKICHPQAKCEYISNVATCTCPHGMFGHGFGPAGCHTSPITDSCEKHMCQNNGNCLATGRGTSCLCLNGYTGALCETADGCHPNPCKNDGTCKSLANQSYKCSCQRGTTGKNCEIIRSVCATIQRRSSGELSYPSDGYTEYAPLERCAWLIRTQTTQILNVTFTSFDLEDGECNRDWLQIHDGVSLASQLIGRFCGNALPLGGNILSSQHQLFFWFRSDNATQKSGFKMTWQSQAPICGETLEVAMGGEGIIRSAGYPGKMPKNRDCEWQLTAPYGQRFILRFYEINTGLVADCKGDSLKIYDADVLIKEFCQSASPEPLRSSTNKVKIHLHTDILAVDSSFQLHYEVESSLPHCGGIFTDASGVIVGPSGDSSVCLYLIQQPSNTQIQLEVKDLNLLEMENCNLNSFEIFDGKTDQDLRLFMKCGSVGVVRDIEPISTSSNFLLLRYINKLAGENSKIPFRVKYSRVCEFRYFGPDGGVITTPNYPSAYAEHLTCTYHIYGPLRTLVRANFTDVSLNSNDPTDASNKEDLPTNQSENGTLTYFDVYLSDTNKRRFYKGAPMQLFAEYNKMTIVFHAGTNPHKARGLRLEYSFEENNCGGVFTDNGILHFDKGFDVFDKTCIYIFEAAPGRNVELSFNITTLGGVENPAMIYGIIPGEKDYLLKNITKEKFVNEVFPFNTIRLLIHANVYLFIRQYKFISTNTDCVREFSSLYGTIKSPNWPLPYSANLNCSWIITAPLGFKIELRIQNFTLEQDCSGDFLEIRNGKYSSSPLIGRYCGDRMPSRITSFANSLFLRFTSDDSVQGRGFHLNWEQTETGCGGKLTSYKGSIHSPVWDSMTTEFSPICNWIIQVAQGSSISLNIKTSIDEFQFCSNNHLRIFDGSSTSSPLLNFDCLTVQRKGQMTLTSTSNQLLILYEAAEDSMSNAEFILDYETNCNMVLDHIVGIIESPNFPEPYPELLNCKWDIEAGSKNKIQLAFSHLSLETDSMQCEHDYVEVWDMQDSDVLTKQRLCTHQSQPITSQGNHFRLLFVTDYSNSKNGFRAEYSRQGCGQVLTERVHIITSPNYPHSIDVDCDYYIEVTAGQKIILNVLEFQTDTEMENCDFDALIIKESKKSLLPLLEQCSSRQTGPLTVTSNSNRLYIHYRSSSSGSNKYFKAFYRTEAAQCGGTFIASSGTITSPNFPDLIKQDYKCVWEISVPQENEIQLTIKNIEKTLSDNCTDNYLKISYRSQNATEFRCLSALYQNLLLIPTNTLSVEFVSKSASDGVRFAMAFAKQCGGTIAKDSGVIKANSAENCKWTFNEPEGTLISINILQFDCYCGKTDQAKTECGKRGLGFKVNYFGSDISSANFSKIFCEDYQPNVKFEASKLDIFANNVNFHATFSTTLHNCGGIILSPRGSLASPNWPSVYPPNVECTWTLTAPSGNSLQLQFEEMDIAKSEGCNEDFLEIRRVIHTQLLGLYCGNQVAEEVLKPSDFYWIRFRSTEGSSGKGFKLKWSYAHLNEIVNETKGLIKSPPANTISNEDEPFIWRIVVENGKFIKLEFEHYSEGLLLYDGYTEEALPISIQIAPWVFVSSTNAILLKTDNEHAHQFLVKWTAVDTTPVDTNVTSNSTCHSEQTLMSRSVVFLNSPNYPHGYENNLRCDWVFHPANVTHHIVCRVYEVKLEVMDGCTADYMSISSSSDMARWHAGEKLCNGTAIAPNPYRTVHGTPHLKVDFVTDFDVNGTGFRAVIFSECGSNFTQPVGFIQGNQLTRETDCTWQIAVKPGKRIFLQFDFAPLEAANQNTCQEYALIYDGLDEHARLLPPGKICNPQNQTKLFKYSSSNYLTIKYVLILPRPLLPERWNLTYREYSDCNEEYRLVPEAATINITSPNYPHSPHPHTECEWRIVAPPGEIIKVEFEDSFDFNARFCIQEYIELFDGSTSLARSLGKYCYKPPTIRTTQNILTMHFLTDINEPRGAFKARISIDVCGASYSSMRDVVKSPGYPIPGSYPSYSQCDYAISLPGPFQMRLIVEDIHLPFDSENPTRSDHLEIIPLGAPNVPATKFIFGNFTNSTDLEMSTNKVIIRFHTFAKNAKYRGFRIAYRSPTDSNRQHVVGESGVLIMKFPERTQFESYKKWRIEVPKGLRVRLEMLNMDELKEQNTTVTPTFMIYNDERHFSQITSFDANNYTTNQVIQSSDNTMSVHVSIPATDVPFRTVKARYSSSAVSPCPQPISEENRAGLVDINDKQDVFNANYLCHTPIQYKEGTLVFNISSLVYEHVASSKTTHPVLVFAAGAITVNYRQNLTQVLQPSNQEIGYYLIAQSEYERIRRLTMSYRLHKCGGHMLVDRLNTAHPKETDLNYGAIMCVWTLSNPPYLGGGGFEHRLFGNFSFSEGCGREFVLIRERRWDAEPTKKICQDNQDEFDSFVVKSSLTFIVYQAENYSSQKTNFFMRTRKTLLCGSETSVTNFLSAVQVDFAHYENNQECSWVFYTEQGKYLQITFYNRFFIEASENCTKDYLEVQNYVDGLWIPGQRFCGRELPPAYNSTTHRLRLVFRTNEAVRGDGFTLNVRSQCSVTLNVTSELRTIESPYSSGMGATRLRCDYVFKSNEIGKLISVRTIYNQEFSPPLQSGCMFGFTPYKLNATGQEQAVKTHCETNFEERAYYYLKLSYVAYSAARYTIEYGLDSCGGNITTTATLIQPLKHESSTNGYAENMNCVWYVTAPDERSIAVQFKYFDTEKDCDHVSIYAGYSIEQDKLVQQLSGNLTNRPPTVLVEGNRAVINAISDVSNSAKGFQAMVVFLPNCNERISLTEGNSPLNLARTFKLSTEGEQYICQYRLNAPKGYRVGVNVKKIQLNHDLVNCQNSNDSCARGLCNSVEIFDSLAVGQLSMGKFCQTANLSMVSSYEDAMVKFVAKEAGQQSFEILLTLEKSACGPTTEFQLNDKENLTLTCPLGNASTYGANMHCNWFIRSNKSLEFLFTYIDLQNVSQVTDKCLDYIEIKYRDTTDTICGRSSHYSFTVDEHLAWEVLQYSNVEIVFHSDDQIEGRGFELKVKHQDVGNRFFNQLSASITAYYETSIGNNTITVPENYNLNFFITVGYIPRQEECDPKKFFIIDLKINETIFNLCERYRDFSIPLYTTTNTVRVESMRSSAVQTLNYWVSDKKDPLGCGGILQSRKGSIMSPPYGNDHNYSECIWNITLPPPNGISLYIESFDMGSETNCHLDNLKIFDIMDDGTEKLLKSLCGLEESAQLVISKSNRIAVVSRKSPNFDGTGWSLSYQPKEPWMVD